MKRQAPITKLDYIPLNTWLIHRHSRNAFKVIKIHALHVDTLDRIGSQLVKGGTNRYILEQDLKAGVYYVDPEGAS